MNEKLLSTTAGTLDDKAIKMHLIAYMVHMVLIVQLM